MEPRPLHVVFGAGQIGAHLARVLVEAGCDVRVVRRTQAAPHAGTTQVEGDAGDPEFAARAARGAVAVYHCMNPAYDARVWARELPRILASLITAAGHAGARLVVLDNLYMHGRVGGGVIDEDTPSNPASPKGEVRARVAGMLFDAHRRGDVRAVAGRASDFYGPGGVNTFFERRFWTRVFSGRSAQFFTDPSVPHTFHYTRDVAAGLAALGRAEDDVTGRWWMLPAEPAVAPRELVGRFARALGRGIAVERVPAAVVTAMGWFVPIVRELLEMRYQWSEPLRVSDRRFRERFGLAATPLDQGAAETVAWAKEAFGG
jgi:nucleoside-diphosphate-sugar epimerase